MSFAGGYSPAEERAVLAAYNEGILSVVAAGNEDSKHHTLLTACYVSTERITPRSACNRWLTCNQCR